MTLAPLISPNIRGREGKPGALTEGCVAPGCSSAAQQRHHLWPKSYLRGQPVEWVDVHGVTLQNTVGLCLHCHQLVTGEVGGHRAHIRYNQESGIFEWWAKSSDDRWFYVGLVTKVRDGQPEAKRIRRKEGLCPECGKPLHKEHIHKPGPKRKTSSWNVVVPDDAEIGSEQLDDWTDHFAVLLGFGEAPTRLRRFHVLSLVLAWAAMNETLFLEDLERAEFWAKS